MKAKVENESGSVAGDVVKYALAVLLLAGGMYAYSYFASWPGALRSLLPIVATVAAALVFGFTAKGLQVREYMGEARFELRKVVWPTRQETMQGTLMIMVVVVVASLVLALIDLVLSSGVRFLLG